MSLESIPTVCASVAAKPSKLGVALHNAGYNKLNLPYTYIALGASEVNEALDFVRRSGGRGLGVSMPFKHDVITELDTVTDDVTKIGACNTVVFQADGTTVGHNTDWIGARNSLRESGCVPKRAVIVGAGGVARAIAYALQREGVEVLIRARRIDSAERVVGDLGLLGAINLDGSVITNVDLVVNATPDASAAGPVQLSQYPDVAAVFDVVFASLSTPLTDAAAELGLHVAPGWRMLLHQALEQFRLYTGEEPPEDEMADVLRAAFTK